MAEKMQRRIPKWDVVAEPHDENVGHDHALPGKVDDTCLDLTEVDTIKPILPMNVDGSEINQSANQSGEEINNKIIHSVDIPEKTQYSEQFDLEGGCKDGFKKQAWEPASQDRTMAEYVENQDKSQKVASDMSPRHEESYHRTCNMPPVDERSRSHRKRSRSRSRSLSYDSRSRSWSRSKSPSCVSKQGSERWTDKSRTRGMTAVCKSFATGMCRRGNECRFLHEGGGWRQIDRHHDAGLTDGRGSRHERERQLAYESKESLTDTRERNNYSRENFSRRREEHREANNRQHQGYRSNERCYDFTQGKCFRGETCRYIHHAASLDGGWSVRDESRERFYDRRGAGSGSFNRRQEHQRLSDIPCKYFLQGHCIHGEGCRFYHQVEPLNIPVQRSLDGSQHSFVSGGSAGNITSANATELQVQTPHFRATNSCGENEAGVSDTQPIDKQTFTNISLFDSHPAPIQDAHKEIQPNEQQTTPPKVSELSANNPLTTTSIAGQNTEHKGQSQFASMILQAQNLAQNSSIQPFAPPLPLKGQMQPVMQSHHQNGKNQFAAFHKPPDTHSFNANIQNPSANSAYYQLNSQSLDPRGQVQQNLPMLSLSGSNLNLNGQIQQNGPLIHDAQSQPDFLVGGQNQQNLVSHIGHGHQDNIIAGDPQQILPQNVQSQVQSVPSHVSNGQNHLVALPQPSNPQIFISDEKNCELTTKNISMQIGQRADSSEVKPSLTSDNSITRKLVTSEQAAKITGLSASLAQFFGSTARNSQSSAVMAPQAFLNPSPMGSFATPVAPRPPEVEGSQTNLSQSTPKPNQQQIHVIDNIKQVDASSSKELKQIEAQGANKEQLAELQNGDEEGMKDEDSRKFKSKERMFKCILVEFVKDILKPIWKEGQLSKEAYKTIVKKVVDKVCSSLQGPNLPQTQEKIDLYLSNSKPKLSKLVQAYVEKFVNS